QLYKYNYDLYEKDRAVQERRRSNRLNPKQEWKTFGRPNLEREIAKEKKQEKRKFDNRMELPMEEDEDEQLDGQPMYERPVGPNVPKGYRYSKKRGEYYDSLEGIRKW